MAETIVARDRMGAGPGEKTFVDMVSRSGNLMVLLRLGLECYYQ